MHQYSNVARAYPAMYGRRSNSRPFPLVNVQENAENITLEVMAPGRKKEDFQISLKGDRLTLGSESESEFTDNYRSAEFKLMPFKRSFRVVTEIDEDKIQARYTDGVLYVTLPKKTADVEKTAKTIEIQ
jgi:HSP20 family protein